MEYGAHLPLIAFEGHLPRLQDLREYARTACEAEFGTLAVNDHLVFPRPWLDAPTALASVLDVCDEKVRLATTVALPVIRGPIATAKWLAAVDTLSNGRVIAGVGPGSSQRDYALAGVPWEERWKRLDDAVATMRALWRGEEHRGPFYVADGAELEAGARRGGPPVWIGSWGSPAGLRRVARAGDGWLASAYNTTPEHFAQAWTALCADLEALGRASTRFRNALATTWTYVTDDAAEADEVLERVLAPTLGRDPAELRERVLIGHPEECARRIEALEAAGVQRIYVWPVRAPVEQLRRFHEEVAPLVGPAAGTGR